mgnify:CR=1 FL=1
MKKIYLITPMKGRTLEKIEAYRAAQKRVAEAVFGEEVEIIDSLVAQDAPKDSNEAVYYLGKAISHMAEADVVVFPNERILRMYKGCRVEADIVNMYEMCNIELPRLPEDDELMDERNKMKEAEELKRVNAMRRLNNLPEFGELPLAYKGGECYAGG